MTMNWMVLTAALAVASLGQAWAAQEVITKSFDASQGGKLLMKVDRGAIHVKPGTSDKVEVRVVRELKNTSEDQAKSLFEKHKISFGQQGDTVTIETPEQRSIFNSNKMLNKLRVDYTVTVPSKFDLELKTAGGNIDVGNLEGVVGVRTAGGNVSLGSINGPVTASTSGGNVSLESGKGNADLQTSGGDIRVGELAGDLVGRTSGGRIHLSKISGKADVATSGGDVRVEEAYGPVLARTSGGNVSASILQQPKGNCALKTSGGNVDVTLASDMALALNARTSGGRVQSDFPGDLSKDRMRLTAELNGGGPEMLLQTSGGDVHIRKQK